MPSSQVLKTASSLHPSSSAPAAASASQRTRQPCLDQSHFCGGECVPPWFLTCAFLPAQAPGDVPGFLAVVSTGSPCLKISEQPASSYCYVVLSISSNCSCAHHASLLCGFNMGISSQLHMDPVKQSSLSCKRAPVEHCQTVSHKMQQPGSESLYVFSSFSCVLFHVQLCPS